MSEIKIADISLLNFCNFSCNYCIANSVKEKPIVDENGYIKILDPRYDGRGNKTLLNAKRNNVPFENESFNKWAASHNVHPRGHFLDLNALKNFCITHLNGWLLTLSGGEPLLYPKIEEFLKDITTTHNVVVLTNASLIHGKKELFDIPKEKIFYRVGFHPEQRTIDSFTHAVDLLKDNDTNYIVNYILHPQHIKDGTYQNYIDILKFNDYPYEITRYEGIWEKERYSCHLPMKDWEMDIIGDYSKYVELIPSTAPGSQFLAITAGGDVYECHNRVHKMGSVYGNWLNNKPINSPSCFTNRNVCPSIKANYDIYQKLNHPQS